MDKETNDTIKSYSLGAQKYIEMTDQLSYFEGLTEMLNRFIALLPGKRVVDVAFGSGRDILYFLSKGLEVEGVELTKDFVDILQTKVGVPLYHMDMRELSFPSSSFDGVWCCSSFLHIPRQDASKTLLEFSRILRPQGVLFLSLKEGQGEEWVTKGNVGKELPRYFIYYTYDKIYKMLREAGLAIVYEERQRNRIPEKPVWLSIICQKPE